MKHTNIYSQQLPFRLGAERMNDRSAPVVHADVKSESNNAEGASAKSTKEKVVFISGAARRIGAAIARLLHESGANIVIHYRNSQTEAYQLAEELNHIRPGSADTVCAKLTHVEEFPELIKNVISRWGRLDALINNASLFFPTPADYAIEQQWDELMTANLKAPYFLIQQAAPYLAKNNGCIVNITDIHAEQAMRNYSIYCISKAGLVMLTKALAKEFAPNIRVNGVAPGAIMWPEGENTLTAEGKEKIIKSTPLHKHGNPKDIALAVRFLLNDAPFITGQIISVDGGRSL